MGKPVREAKGKEAAEMSCGISFSIRASLSTAQQDMKSNLYFTSLTICQCKELVLFPLLLSFFFFI